ncbi:MAG: hypothetical protein HDQ89_00260 [Desulfovibrio sp.]|nr:hypothetical protein [Desulfovibrio sp.]
MYDDNPAGFLPWSSLVEGAYQAWRPAETKNHAALPVPLKIQGKTMFQWIPVAIAVLRVIKESMDE